MEGDLLLSYFERHVGFGRPYGRVGIGGESEANSAGGFRRALKMHAYGCHVTHHEGVDDAKRPRFG
jgi:hypothetical protein